MPDPGPPTIDAPRLSVIVPAYDSARSIGRCLEALASQRTRHRFVVDVLHAGRYPTCAAARRALPAARVVQLPSRRVAAAARTVGVAVSRGDVLGFIDSDAYAAPDWVDRAVDASDRDVDLVCGAIANANPHSGVSRAEQFLMFNEFLPGARERASWFALSGNMVMRRATYERFGPFPEVRAAEDVVFSRQLVAAGGTILFAPWLVVSHDNRTRLGDFLRNQMLVARHTAVARRLVRFADMPRYWPFLLCLPVAPLAKLWKIVLHVARGNPRALGGLARAMPLVAVGACAYGVGLVRGALVSQPALAPSVSAR
jgi:cellulose synthase/poly-beta-1,6-N-acetylglucosamine synthase-like glycosyltransferase